MTIAASNKGKPVYAGPKGQKVYPPEFKKLLYAVTIFNPCVWCCCSFMKVRGLPRDAVPLGESEKSRFLQKFQGSWKIEPISLPDMGGDGYIKQYTDANINGDKIIFSGGVHTHTTESGTIRTIPNDPKEQLIIPFRGGDGKLYIDNLGSIFVREGEDNSEIEIDNCMDMKLKFVRPWKIEGNSGPNQGNRSSSIADEISKLQKLYEDGVLSPEEFRSAKLSVITKS